jgi:protein-tyrosine-phosphatase
MAAKKQPDPADICLVCGSPAHFRHTDASIKPAITYGLCRACEYRKGVDKDPLLQPRIDAMRALRPKPLLVVGVDPGGHDCGVAWILFEPDGTFRSMGTEWIHRGQGVKDTKTEHYKQIGHRCRKAWQLDTEDFDQADWLLCYEDSHVAKRGGKILANAVKSLSEVIGVIVATSDIEEVVKVQPAEWKQAVSGSGSASYELIQRSLNALFKEVLADKAEHELAAMSIAYAAGVRKIQEDRWSKVSPKKKRSTQAVKSESGSAERSRKA